MENSGAGLEKILWACNILDNSEIAFKRPTCGTPRQSSPGAYTAPVFLLWDSYSKLLKRLMDSSSASRSRKGRGTAIVRRRASLKQRGAPVRPEPTQQYPEDAVAEPEFRAFDGLLEDRHLLSQCEDLDSGGSAATNAYPEKYHHRWKNVHDSVLQHSANGHSYWNGFARAYG